MSKHRTIWKAGRRTATQRNPRRGFTLLEIMLVAAIIVALAALAYPSIESSYRGVRVEAGVDTLRTAMARARVQAMEDGRPYRVSIRPGYKQFRVAPESSEYWNGSQLNGDAVPTGQQVLIMEEEGPDRVQFSLVGEPVSVQEDDKLLASQVDLTEWRTAAVFFPDGTAHKDVNVLVRYEQSQSRTAMVLTVRSLTGAIGSRRAQPEELE